MGEPDSKTRTSDVSSMLDYAFAQYETETFLSTESILDTININKGKKEYVNIVPKENVTILNKKTDNKKNATYNLEMYDMKLPLKKVILLVSYLFMLMIIYIVILMLLLAMILKKLIY